MNKAVGDKKSTDNNDDILLNNDYLKKLKLDNSKTNIEQVKELKDKEKYIKTQREYITKLKRENKL